MSKYRAALPQLSERVFLMDGGLETTLVFHQGIDLPFFAAADLLKDKAGTQRLRTYYDHYAGLAAEAGLGFVLDSPNWRSSPDWGARMGLSLSALEDINRSGVALMEEIRQRHETARAPMVVSGVVGPRGDGYKAEATMSAAEARDYHAWQIGIFARTSADMVAAYTLNYVEEAIGIALAAREAGLPAAVSFTLETDGRLPSGQSLKDAIRETDAATAGAPAYYLINCAHPTHFAGILEPGADWTARLRGLRANASRRSHAELDASPDLDAGDPVELGRLYRDIRTRMPQFTVLGGCCGTDHRHVEQIRFACTAQDRVA
ncbi:homocysteine S-methyltransferase family protein [Xanthobacter dioxanivorans]|uniref:Homocysteine S-methyltransferase family protein n=1 Tax=Xanthobacter dioxanivorans TaxID=2528964 RepID=A0A974PK64_9HYPH|nr:homocysteine S-methyltransferase family protein [Xanthobacter dioxanivorans]QRG05097.1 homocysteine S-methyltransferase family protein [Xanthobacter dioxanivorans]